VINELEVHVEQLLGKRVRDVDGVLLGRIEELWVEVVDGESVVTEWHLGPAALWERLGGMALRLPFFGVLSQRRKLRRIPWQMMDVTDWRHPRLRGTEAQLMSAGIATRRPG
jgi:hypothetical protein